MRIVMVCIMSAVLSGCAGFGFKLCVDPPDKLDALIGTEMAGKSICYKHGMGLSTEGEPAVDVTKPAS